MVGWRLMQEARKSVPKSDDGRARQVEHLIVIVLCGAIIVCLAAGILLKPGPQSWRSFASAFVIGLAGAFAAALLTFLLIDMALTRQRAEEDRRTHERERRKDEADALGRYRESLLARLRAGTADENRGVIEEFRSLGWFRDGFMRSADFSGASLAGVDLDAADLRFALFVGCDLRRASFRGSDLFEARFSQADVRGARFDDARTNGADFTNVRIDDDTVLG
jgi:hypothetical protein